MSLYSEFQSFATELLTEFNQGQLQSIKITKTNGATEFDAPTLTPVATDIVGVVSGVSDEFIDGVMITTSDLMITAAIGDYTVSVGDSVSIDGVSRKVLKFQPIPPAGVPVVNKIIVKG